MNNIIHSIDPDTDTFKCPKCGAIWRAKGHYNDDDGGWAYDEVDEERCPRGCKNLFGLRRIKGKLTYRADTLKSSKL